MTSRQIKMYFMVRRKPNMCNTTKVAARML